MKAHIQENNDVVVFRLEGQLTSESCIRLREKATELLSSTRKAIVFDMSAVSWIDSEGLELLLWIRDYCRLSVVQFRLAGLTDNCSKILEMTRLDSEFHCGVSIPEAVNSLA
ncbi:STAS domain-containing protein [Planctomycetota bacterium]